MEGDVEAERAFALPSAVLDCGAAADLLLLLADLSLFFIT